MSLNVGKQEISFPISVSKESKNSFLEKLFLLFNIIRLNHNVFFFERIPGLDVSGEIKTGCVLCPIWKTFYYFYATPNVNTHKNHK